MSSDPSTEQVLMPAETLKALRGSIAKWEAIVAGTGCDDGPDNCALCVRFIDHDCEGCPVADRTGEEGCNESPYEDWFELVKDQEWPKMATSDQQRAAAQVELDFLKSLLPTGEHP